MLNFILKNRQNACAAHMYIDKGHESTYADGCLRKRLLSMLLATTGDSIMEMQK